jgi:hypothetical protein
MVVAVDALSGTDAAAEQARLDDAIATLNATLAPFGVTLVEKTGGDDPNADIHLHLSSTSTIGGVASGVLGVTEGGGQFSIITGWNYYFGSDASAMASDQYDFETVVMHELGHAVGLGHSKDGNSVMFPTLGTDQSRRDLTAADLTVIEAAEDGTPEPLRAANPVAGLLATVSVSAAAPVAVAAAPVANQLWFAPDGTILLRTAADGASAPAPKQAEPAFDPFDVLAAVAAPVVADAAPPQSAAQARVEASDAFDVLGLGGPWGV